MDVLINAKCSGYLEVENTRDPNAAAEVSEKFSKGRNFYLLLLFFFYTENVFTRSDKCQRVNIDDVCIRETFAEHM